MYIEIMVVVLTTNVSFFACLYGALFAISDGMTYGWSAPMIPYLISGESHIKTTKSEAEWLETVIMIGAVVGMPLTIHLVDAVGRKKSIILAAVLSCIGWITLALADKMIYSFIAEFFLGVTSILAFVAAPMYVAEIADQKIRGFLSSIIYVMMLVGLILMYIVGPYCPYYVAPVFAAIFLTIEIICFSMMPESPYYLLYLNKFDEARESLQYFRHKVKIDIELNEISQAVQRQKLGSGSIKDLFLVKSNRKALIILPILNVGQNFAANNYVMSMNFHLILEAAGSTYMDSSLAAILFGVLLVIAAQISSLHVDKFGRKIVLIASSILSGICLLVLAIYFNLVANVSWIPI